MLRGNGKIRVLNLANTAGRSSGGIGSVVHALTKYENLVNVEIQ